MNLCSQTQFSLTRQALSFIYAQCRRPSHETPRLAASLTAGLVPVYLFFRSSKLKQNFAIPIVWCVAFLVSFSSAEIIANTLGVPLDTAAIEADIETGIQSQTGVTATVTCPSNPSCCNTSHHWDGATSTSPATSYGETTDSGQANFGHYDPRIPLNVRCDPFSEAARYRPSLVVEVLGVENHERIDELFFGHEVGVDTVHINDIDPPTPLLGRLV